MPSMRPATKLMAVLQTGMVGRMISRNQPPASEASNTSRQ